MKTLNNIAFFWIGPDTTIPTLLVRSIRIAFGPHFNVIQLSDRSTPRVEGVTSHKQFKLSPHIMVARLEAYAALSLTAPTLFLDADMLVLRPFDVDIHNRTVGTRQEFEEIRGAPEAVCLAHFKGRESKQVMREALSMLESG